MFNPGDKVRIKNGFYEGMEGHIEGINQGEKNYYTVALKNDSGHVNTKLPPNRLEKDIDYGPIRLETLKTMGIEIEKVRCILDHVDTCLNSIIKHNSKN